VRYCCLDHQRAHWSMHRTQCKAKNSSKEACK
jgi:hypothetical protein